jgi:hypothetical protein
MDCRITSIDPLRAKGDRAVSCQTAQAGFTLVEIMMASGLGAMALVVILLLSLYSSRSFAAIANYVDMDERSQLTLDKMSREIRQAHRLVAFTPTSITIEDSKGAPVSFSYDADSRTLLRTAGGISTTNLTECDTLQFSNYQGTIRSNTFDAYNEKFVTNSRLIQVTWTCSRSILGAKMNTESVQSAKIVIRNN